MQREKGIKISADLPAMIVAFSVVLFFLIVPISINETIGFSQVAAMITNQEDVNPYYIGNTQGEVAGISTTNGATSSTSNKTANILGMNIEVNRQTVLVLTVVTLSVVVFTLLFTVLTVFEKKQEPKEILPAIDLSRI